MGVEERDTRKIGQHCSVRWSCVDSGLVRFFLNAILEFLYEHLFVLLLLMLLYSCRVSSFLPQCTVTQMIHSNLIPSIIIFSSSFVIQRFILWLHHTVVYTTFIYLFIHVFLYTHIWVHTHIHTGVCTDLIQDVCLITSKNLSMAWTSPTLLLLCKVGVAVVITVGWLVV